MIFFICLRVMVLGGILENYHFIEDNECHPQNTKLEKNIILDFYF